MTEHRVYCDECKHLEKRPIYAEVPQFSGNYAKTGERYYCSKFDKWYAINTTKELVGYSFCTKGSKK